MNSWSSSTVGGSVKTATRVAMPLLTRSAASSAPASLESRETTITSAGASGSLTTSARPAARRIVSLTEGTATMAAVVNPTTTRIGEHLGRRELMLGSKFHVSTWKARRSNAVVDIVKFAGRRSTVRVEYQNSQTLTHAARRPTETSIAKTYGDS